MRFSRLVLPLGLVFLASCGDREAERDELHPRAPTYHQDVVFLARHTKIHVLRDAGGGRVAVAPDWQGRVMTTSCQGEEGRSLGWIGYRNIRSATTPPGNQDGQQCHRFGGEEYLWLGPEGGPHALFFASGAPFEANSWKVPAGLDAEPFEVVSGSDAAVQMRKDLELTNRAGTKFHVRIARAVQILDKSAIAQWLGVPVPDQIHHVGYMSTNSITNLGKQKWSPEKGMLSIRLFSKFRPSLGTHVVIPLATTGEGPAVSTDFADNVELDDSRLRVTEDRAFFKVDGAFRSKIGIPPQKAKSLLGSWDPEHNRLTVIRFNLPEQAATLAYPRSQWQDHARPYAGNAASVSNGGAPMGGYYEIESSSPALPLSPEETLTHVLATIHFEGDRELLENLAEELFGVGLEQIEGAFQTAPK